MIGNASGERAGGALALVLDVMMAGSRLVVQVHGPKTCRNQATMNWLAPNPQKRYRQ